MSEPRTNGAAEKSKEDEADAASLVHRKSVLSQNWTRGQPKPSRYQSLAQYPWDRGLLHWLGSW